MYEKETYDVILDRMLGRVSDKLDKRPSSLIYDTHSSTAVELQTLYIELEYLIKNSYGDTAAREYLILLAKDRGLSPYPATSAILQGEFTPTKLDVTGKRFNIGDINYTVLERISEGKYQVQCESKGVIGNQYMGDMIPMEYIDGLQTAQLTKILVPGEDEEDTEEFRKRYFETFSEQAFGGNRADYLEKVRSVDGVGNCKVTRVWNGDIRPTEMIPSAAVQSWYEGIIQAGGLNGEVKNWLTKVYTATREKKLTVGGTVLVTVINSLNFGKAEDVLLQKIQTKLDPEQNAGEGYGLAPIGHVVRVKSAETVEVTITTTLTFEEGYGWNNLKTAIQEAAESYLLELRKEWADSTNIVVRISQLETRILGVKGVVDITDTKVNGSTNNFNLTEYQIPVLGGVSE